MELIYKFKQRRLTNIGINRVIWLLTFTDVFSWGIYFGILPLVGIYLSKTLGANAVEMIGIGTGIYYLSRMLSQIPVGIISDRIKKDRDDILLLCIGCALLGLPFLFFPSIQHQSTYFVLQFILGIGTSFNLVNWRKLFAQNLDVGREGYSYAIYDTILSGLTGLFGVAIGLIANTSQFYFDLVMTMGGLIIISSAFWASLIFLVRNRRTK
jgi:MFS family permease